MYPLAGILSSKETVDHAREKVAFDLRTNEFSRESSLRRQLAEVEREWRELLGEDFDYSSGDLPRDSGKILFS